MATFNVVEINKIVYTLGPCFSGLDDAGTCPDNEKVRIKKIYLYNANMSIYKKYIINIYKMI